MTCYRPLVAYRDAGGSVQIGYEPPGSTERLQVPCGYCFGCRMEYAESWATRLKHEASCWDHNFFVTLTYSDECLPPFAGLDVSHLQKFMKRLRKSFVGQELTSDSRRPIRFFAAGEYGTTTDRPHFHVALFNLRFPEWRLGKTETPELERLWPLGSHQLRPFDGAAAAYIAGYAVKKVRGKLEREARYGAVDTATGEWLERPREFVVMSRRPGIGGFFFERYRSDFERGYVTEPGGARRRLPRFYRKRLLMDEKFAARDEERMQEWLSTVRASEFTPERLEVREEVAKARKGAYSPERGF